jgi:hypothetical protein
MGSRPPESGFLVEVARSPQDQGPPWYYLGTVLTPSVTYEMTAVVEVDRTVRVELGDEAPPRLVRVVANLVHSACAVAESDEGPSAPPHKIVRWDR